MRGTDTIEGHYRGKPSELFGLAMKTSLLTLLTLGIYRFWGRTRIRKYIWASTLGDSDAFEYTGTGLEKFLGFLIAVVILAVYLAVVQAVLAFLGMSYSFDPTTPEGELALNALLFVNLLATAPLMIYASYRARRYKTSRTRWRGVRFGMEKGAWGYTIRALGYYLLVGLSFGALLPLATFRLEKYMVDRTWFGDAKFVQHGSWVRLYRGMLHIAVGLVLMAAGGASIIALFVGAEGADGPSAAEMGGLGTGGLLLGLGYVWMFLGGIYYRYFAMRYFINTRQLGERVFFTSDLRPMKTVGITVLGAIVLGAIWSIVAFVGMIGMVGTAASLGAVGAFLPLVTLVLYVVMIVITGAMWMVFVSQPLWAYVAGQTQLVGAPELDGISQRAAAQNLDAEGFADALDVGGGF